MQKTICLVIPCYQEEKRLQYLQLAPLSDVIFIFVDDGSTDNTNALLKKLATGADQVIKLPENRGKAEAVRQGFLFAMGLESTKNCDWIGFWDADFATPLSELIQFNHIKDAYPHVGAIWGSRVYRAGAKIERSFKRHVFGRLFATFAKLYLDLDTYDSQCGAKIFRRDLIPSLFSEPFLSKWLFDIELYFRLKKISAELVECPLREWRDVSGGQLKVGKLFFRTIRDLIRIKKAYF